MSGFLRLWGIAFMAAIVMAFPFAVQQSAQAGPADQTPFIHRLATQLLPLCSWAFLTPVMVEIVRRLQTLPLHRSVPLHLLAAPALVAVQLALMAAPTRALGYFLPGSSIVHVWRQLVVLRGASELIYVAGILAVIHAVTQARRARQEELERAHLAQEMLEARLDSLRLQLEPHFLFNTLNNISALAAAGRRQSTEKAIAETGQLLREALRRPDIVTVERELEYLTLYLRIMQLGRTGETVSVEVEPDTLPESVPSFILQPLVENALRHGRAPGEGKAPAEVRVRRRHGQVELSVVNELRANHPPPSNWMSGIGIRNTRRRLELLYGEKADLTVHESGERIEVRVTLPARCSSGIVQAGFTANRPQSVPVGCAAQ